MGGLGGRGGGGREEEMCLDLGMAEGKGRDEERRDIPLEEAVGQAPTALCKRAMYHTYIT